MTLNKWLLLLLVFSAAVLVSVIRDGAAVTDIAQAPADPVPQPSHLTVRLDSVKLDPSTLERAVEVLRKLSGANIVVEWGVLHNAGLERKQRVSVRLENVSLDTALRVLLEDANDAIPPPNDRTRVAFAEGDDGVITISTPYVLENRTVTRIYDVWDLNDTLRRRSPNVDVSDTLVKVMEACVDPISWRDNAGSAGSISTTGDLLIVDQTEANQKKVAQILQELRTGKGEHFLPATRPSSLF
jgi:hypothetical protein